MSGIRLRSPRPFSTRTIALVFCAAAFVAPAMAAESSSRVPDFSGQWGRDMLFFEPPPSGPCPVINSVRKADGTVTPLARCCTIVTEGGWLGDPTNPILNPEAAEAVKKFGEFVFNGTVAQDLAIPAGPSPHPM